MTYTVDDIPTLTNSEQKEIDPVLEWAKSFDTPYIDASTISGGSLNPITGLYSINYQYNPNVLRDINNAIQKQEARQIKLNEEDTPKPQVSKSTFADKLLQSKKDSKGSKEIVALREIPNASKFYNKKIKKIIDTAIYKFPNDINARIEYLQEIVTANNGKLAGVNIKGNDAIHAIAATLGIDDPRKLRFKHGNTGLEADVNTGDLSFSALLTLSKNGYVFKAEKSEITDPHQFNADWSNELQTKTGLSADELNTDWGVDKAVKLEVLDERSAKLKKFANSYPEIVTLDENILNRILELDELPKDPKEIEKKAKEFEVTNKAITDRAISEINKQEREYIKEWKKDNVYRLREYLVKEDVEAILKETNPIKLAELLKNARYIPKTEENDVLYSAVFRADYVIYNTSSVTDFKKGIENLRGKILEKFKLKFNGEDLFTDNLEEGLIQRKNPFLELLRRDTKQHREKSESLSFIHAQADSAFNRLYVSMRDNKSNTVYRDLVVRLGKAGVKEQDLVTYLRNGKLPFQIEGQQGQALHNLFNNWSATLRQKAGEVFTATQARFLNLNAVTNPYTGNKDTVKQLKVGQALDLLAFNLGKEGLGKDFKKGVVGIDTDLSPELNKEVLKSIEDSRLSLQTVIDTVKGVDSFGRATFPIDTISDRLTSFDKHNNQLYQAVSQNLRNPNIQRIAEQAKAIAFEGKLSPEYTNSAKNSYEKLNKSPKKLDKAFTEAVKLVKTIQETSRLPTYISGSILVSGEEILTAMLDAQGNIADTEVMKSNLEKIIEGKLRKATKPIYSTSRDLILKIRNSPK